MRVILAAIFMVISAFSVMAQGEVIREKPSVVDGDTVKVGRVRMRIAGLDTPEIKFASCQAEKLLGLQAKERLQELTNTMNTRIIKVGRDDIYHRPIIRMYVGRQSVASILIREGLGVEYYGGRRTYWINKLCPDSYGSRRRYLRGNP